MTLRRKVGDLLQTGWVAYAIRETAIVTLGILLAFALNAWWEDHKESRDEERHLRALASDFARNEAELKSIIEFEEGISSASIELLQLDNPRAEEVRAGFGKVFNSRRFEPVMGAYEALINSAGLTLITDDELRADLAQFAAALNTRYGERFSDGLYFEFVREFTGRLAVTDVILNKPVDAAHYVDLLADARFREYLALRYSAERDVGTYYKTLLKTCERINSKVRAARS